MFIPVIIITLSILILIHELGHFLVAKKFGIKVLEFGFGIPPRAIDKKIGETRYSLNWLPFGGFVKLLGEDEVIKEVLDDKRSFANQHVLKRIIVVVAGVVMNLALAWILFYAILIAQDFRIIYPTIEPVVVIAEVKDNFPAKAAGIKAGDRLISLDDKKMDDFEMAAKFVRSKNGDTVKVTFSDIDGNNKRIVEVTPKKVSDKENLIGVVFSPVPFKQYNTLPEKTFSAITYSYDMVRLTFAGFGSIFNNLFVGNYSKVSEQVSGPIGIAAVSKEVLKSGVWDYLWFVALISLSLAIFNVLPIPALDGGRLFFLIIEGITRKKINATFEKYVHTAGLIVLLTLIVLISISDIHKFIL